MKAATLLAGLLVVPVVAGAQAIAPVPEPAQYPAPPPAPAPPPPPLEGKWWKVSEIVRELGLTEQQVNQIEQNFFEHRLKLIDLKAEVERQEARLQPLIEADQIDEAKISPQIDLVLAARIKLEKANVMMMLSIRRVLSVEQWRKLESIKAERNWDRPHRPGHPPRPPRPPEEL